MSPIRTLRELRDKAKSQVAYQRTLLTSRLEEYGVLRGYDFRLYHEANAWLEWLVELVNELDAQLRADPADITFAQTFTVIYRRIFNRLISAAANACDGSRDEDIGMRRAVTKMLELIQEIRFAG